jgi:Protein NO VEIN, C-terminal
VHSILRVHMNEAPPASSNAGHASSRRAGEDARVAVNLLLTDARELPVDDPLGRRWVGWQNTATDDQLWEVNRGLWTLGDRVETERIATLSFQGRIQVVAEIAGRTRYDVGGVSKWALSGNVVRPGDPVHDQLKGSSAPRFRNPVGYFDTSRLDSLSTADRASFVVHDRVTMVVTWNPEKWNPHDWVLRGYPEAVTVVASGGFLRDQWATGNRKAGIEPDDRIFLLLQGEEPRGIIGSGTAASRIFTDEHWHDDRAGEAANYVLIEWDTLLLPEDGLPHARLLAQIPEGGPWRPQSSGWVLPPGAAAELETLWAKHLGQAAPSPRRSSPRQGWQLDPPRRKKVEDAAQDRLMTYYGERGWTVWDVRYGNPYDAIATNNDKTLWLEAKGTETSGTAVIVTRGEVQWARDHPGDCVLGVLSNVAFLPNGELDPTSGTFRVFNWNPDRGALAPRDFDFTPADADQLD